MWGGIFMTPTRGFEVQRPEDAPGATAPASERSLQRDSTRALWALCHPSSPCLPSGRDGSTADHSMVTNGILGPAPWIPAQKDSVQWGFLL